MGNFSKLLVALSVLSFCCAVFFVAIIKLPRVVSVEQFVPKMVKINATAATEVVFKGFHGRANTWPAFKRIGFKGDFWVLNNYFKAERSFECLESITYTTHGEFYYLENVLPVLKRWMGPMSVAIFAPGTDFSRSVKVIMYYRECTENSDLVRDFVTFHLYFPIAHMPKNLTVPFSCDDILDDPSEWSSYRRESGLDYPINLGRTIAREAATTHFIFASDIELYPSLNLISMVLQLIQTTPVPDKTVFVAPIFEITEQRRKVPNNKAELVQAIREQFVFYQGLSPELRTFPLYKEWLEKNCTTGSLNILQTVKKTGRWEPFYIGTNEDPPYDERLTWEGRADKMTQAFVMCLLDYNFAILDNAFLVRKPRIKNKAEKKKDKNSRKQSAQINFNRHLVSQLKILYGERSSCSEV